MRWLLVFALLGAVLLAAPTAHASHVSCGQTITTDTTLDSDLADCPGHGVVIGAHGLTLDLAGHTIDGNGSQSSSFFDDSGVFDNGYTDLTVRKGGVTDFTDGVHVQFGPRGHVHDLTIERVTGAAVMIWTSNDQLVEDNMVRDSGAGVVAPFGTEDTVVRHNVVTSTVSPRPFGGISLAGALRSRVSDNDVTGYSRAIELRGPGGLVVQEGHNVVEQNRTWGNTEGILLGLRVFENVVRDNESFDNSFYGIRMVDSDRNRIEGNSLHDNDQAGIRLEHFGSGGGADENVIESNILRENRRGIDLLNDNDENTITGNTVSQSLEDGILVDVTNSGNEVSGNSAFENGDDGIDVKVAASTITGNSVFRNTDWGIEAAAGVTDGGGNRGWSNGEPAQCLNVVCGPGPPASLSLSPQSATNTVGDQHCVTATVADPDGRPTAGVTVRFSVDGDGSAGEQTDAAGTATFCYDGPLAPGTQLIAAFADTDTNGAQDPGEPGDTATKTWVVPASNSCRAIGKGTLIAANGDEASFDLNVRITGGRLRGRLIYRDPGPAERLTARSRAIEALTCTADTASIFGTALVTGSSHPVRFRIDVSESPDTYRIRLGNGYDSGGTVISSGKIKIR